MFMATKKKTYTSKHEGDQVHEPQTNYGNQSPSFESVWMMFQQSERNFQESVKFMNQKFAETDEQFKETDKQFKETGKQFKETDKQFKEIAQRFKQTDQLINNLSGLFTSQWGRLVESMVEGAVVRLLNEAGIEVHYTIERARGCVAGENFEFDILALNMHVLVAIEVKTTLRPSDVKDFVKKMKKFKIYMPTYSQHKVLAGMAFLSAHSGAEIQAQKAGLFLIKAANDSAALLNPQGFEAREF